METIIPLHNESEYSEILQQVVALLPWGHINLFCCVIQGLFFDTFD